MTDFTAEHLAKEAERLRTDPVLNHAVAQLRADALLSLVDADPDDTTKVIQFQQTVKVCNDFMLKLEAFILQGPQVSDEESQPV